MKRIKMGRVAVESHVRDLAGAVRRESQAVTGYLAWMIRPANRSMIHVAEPDGELHPYGSKWVETSESVGRVCTHCRSLHPIDFMNMIKPYQRWKPGEAYAEMVSLIERGEQELTPRNMMNWQHAPEGYVVMGVMDFDDHSAYVQAHASDCATFWFRLMHAVDLSESEFDELSRWMSDMMPEIKVTRDGFKLSTEYDPSVDPMKHLPPPMLPVLLIRTTDEDENGEPDGC